MACIFDNAICTIRLYDVACDTEVFHAKLHVNTIKKEEFVEMSEALLALPNMPLDNKHGLYAQIIDMTEADIVPTAWIVSVLDRFRENRPAFEQKLLCTIFILDNALILKAFQTIIERFYQPLKPLIIVKDLNKGVAAIQKEESRIQSKKVDLSNGECASANPNVLHTVCGDN